MNYKADHLSSDNFVNDIKTSSVATLENISYTAGNLLRAIEIEKVTFDKGCKLNLVNIHLKTLPDKYKLGHVLGHEASWYDVNIDSVSITNKNLFFHNDTLKVEALEIAGLNAEMFRDKRLKFPKIPDKPMIKDIIKGIKLPLIVDTFSLRKGYISYQEHYEGYEDAGTITFEKLTLKGSNLSTLDTDNELKYQASAVLMGKGFLEIEGTVPQSQNNTTYQISGVIHPHELKVYNPMLNFVAGVEIYSGSVKKSTFNFTYNNVASKGSLKMVYSNLKVKFTDSKGNVTKRLDDKLKNFIANTFMVKKDNERADDMRVGKIEFDRNPKKSFLNYWWHSLFSGIKSSIGIKTLKGKG